MNLKLPQDQTTRRPRAIWPLVGVLVLVLALGGCGLDDDDGPVAETTPATTTETVATTPAVTEPATSEPQSTDTPGGSPVQQGATPGVPSAPQGGAIAVSPTTGDTAADPAATTPTGDAESTGQPDSTSSTGQPDATAETPPPTAGTTGTTGSAPPAAAGALPEGAADSAAAPVVGATGGTTPRSAYGAFNRERPFSDASPWNTLTSGLPTDPRSAEMMRLANIRVAIVDRGGGRLQRFRVVNREGLFINRRAWAPPIHTEEGGVTTELRCRQLLRVCGDPVEALAIPTDARPDPRYDGWFTVFDSPNGVAYDFWRARREVDGTISYHFVRRWDLNDSGFLPPERVSARGSGLPLFAGVITPGDIQRGRIDHALAISVPGAAQRRYVQPASRTDGNGDINSLPEGARIRLADDIDYDDLLRREERGLEDLDEDDDPIDDLFDDQPAFDRLDTTSGDPANPLSAPFDSATGARVPDEDEIETEIDYAQLEESLRPDRVEIEEETRRRIAQMILDALRRYGAIVVGRSAVPTLYAQRNVDWRGILSGNEIQGVLLSDFEVIQLGPLYNDPPLFRSVGVRLPGAAAPGVPGTPQEGQQQLTPGEVTVPTTPEETGE